MKHNLLTYVMIAAGVATFVACSDNDDAPDFSVKPYTVPTTYSFGNASYTASTQRVKMTVELDGYLKLANAGAAVVALDQAKVNNMWLNTGNPFADASLNTSGKTLKEATSDADLIKAYADSVLKYNTGAAAAPGTGGFIPRGANKIIVGPRGMEYGQSFVKGIMGSLYFKEAVRILSSVKSMTAKDTTAAQKLWDEAFGYLGVPADYDSSKTYPNTDPNRPLLWGGYLAERGKAIQAGGTIFSAFLKGRAAIGGYDIKVRDEQADIILAKWEQLAAAAALNYVTAPTASSAIGNFGTQLHALSEGQGFISALKYRAANSKLSAANYAALSAIISKDFYVLLNQPGFTDLVAAQNILKTTYGL
ncbi:DUF4856 domain-containing protein [Chitinophaga sp. GCM10012297]|uniref:DUF4856 domain-containing protein n=1 Tax=Chitinophaga chungangae TaxID=2821488 RepID=A0ABS3YL12_9BACT|nr:DUF4856 domain-containing protein [Chitinophaga chungangae]MBO9154794.1 DUF4856 domain-containing protein [Chitinophaga chungangae]